MRSSLGRYKDVPAFAKGNIQRTGTHRKPRGLTKATVATRSSPVLPTMDEESYRFSSNYKSPRGKMSRLSNQASYAGFQIVHDDINKISIPKLGKEVRRTRPRSIVYDDVPESFFNSKILETRNESPRKEKHKTIAYDATAEVDIHGNLDTVKLISHYHIADSVGMPFSMAPV